MVVKFRMVLITTVIAGGIALTFAYPMLASQREKTIIGSAHLAQYCVPNDDENADAPKIYC